MSLVHSISSSPVGDLIIVSQGHDIVRISICGQAHLPDQGTFGARDDTAHTEARTQLCEYFSGDRTHFDLPLRPHGTDFQLEVWTALTTIAFGSTVSYGELATMVGRPKASRAVGSANARNPLCIVIPCHRVIATDGGLGGYAGGVVAKEHLLRLEGALLPQL